MWRKLFTGWHQLPKVSPIEGFLLRLLFALFLIFTIRSQITYESEPHPKGALAVLYWGSDSSSPDSATGWKGIARTLGKGWHHVVDATLGEGPYLTWLANPETWAMYKGIFIALLAVYVSGYGLVVVLPVLAVMHLLPFTLFASQGFNHHGNQIVTCTLIIQAGCVIWYTLTRKFTLRPPDARLSAWMLIQSQVILCGMYFISVFTKLDNSGGMWLFNSKYVAMDMLKTQRQSHLNNLDPIYLGNPPEAIWMLEHPYLAILFFGSGLFMEFFCILAIGHRWLGPIIGISLIIMHRAIDRLMGGVAFLNNELLAFIFLVNLPFFMAWVIERLPKLTARHLAVGGALLGVILSFWLQPANIREAFLERGGAGFLGMLSGIGQYLLALINQMDTWNSLEWEQWKKTLTFLAPVAGSVLALGAVGAVLGSFLGKGNDTTPFPRGEKEVAGL